MSDKKIFYFQHPSKQNGVIKGSAGRFEFVEDEFGRPGVLTTEDPKTVAYMTEVKMREIGIPPVEEFRSKVVSLPDGKYRFFDSRFAGKVLKTSGGKVQFDVHGFVEVEAGMAERMVKAGVHLGDESLEELRKKGIAAGVVELEKMIEDKRAEAAKNATEAETPEPEEKTTEAEGETAAPEPETIATAAETTTVGPETAAPESDAPEDAPPTGEADPVTDTPEEDDDKTGPGLMGLKVKQLLAMAKKRNVAVPAKATKEEIVKLLS